jgi:hypothetical protein
MSSEGKPLNKKTAENRAHTRVETSNLISFQCLDAASKPVHQGMGKALDVSTGGLMLESSDPIETDHVSLLSTDLDNSLIEMAGKVAYSRQSQTGSYKTGIRFMGSSSENIRFAASLIKSFHYRRKRSLNGFEGPKTTSD